MNRRSSAEDVCGFRGAGNEIKRAAYSQLLFSMDELVAGFDGYSGGITAISIPRSIPSFFNL
jgi:hypothetical protein